MTVQMLSLVEEIRHEVYSYNITPMQLDSQGRYQMLLKTLFIINSRAMYSEQFSTVCACVLSLDKIHVFD